MKLPSSGEKLSKMSDLLCSLCNFKAGSEQLLKADLVLLAMGFINPVASVLDAFGVEKDAEGSTPG